MRLLQVQISSFGNNDYMYVHVNARASPGFKREDYNTSEKRHLRRDLRKNMTDNVIRHSISAIKVKALYSEVTNLFSIHNLHTDDAVP